MYQSLTANIMDVKVLRRDDPYGLNKMGPSDDEYHDKILEILRRQPYVKRKDGPVHLIGNYLYLGSYEDAELGELRRFGITHVLNMAEYWRTGSPYTTDSGIVYKGIDADDAEYYDIMQHFRTAARFITQAQQSGHKVLVHCAMGINRSAAICAAYIMQTHKLDLMETIKLMKQRRGVVLINRGFQRRLITFARENGRLPFFELPCY